MKIQLPNRVRIDLDESLTLNEKIIISENLAEEWKEEIIHNWNSNAIRFFLDGLSNYLIWHKDDDKNKQDKEILSIWKIEQMSNKRKANSISFSCLSKADKELLGIHINNDDEESNEGAS